KSLIRRWRTRGKLPRLKTLAEVKGKALMVHVGGDNMADSPQPLGGGGERFACGVIK
ncbi:superoxide dismutase family protein, partial [Klebsiella pneumoniae]|uniref:superoxide dismutase family protein n=1 Tax=Klebsiella pneumoniae TaxID=573 RepID=UPI003967E7BF